MKTYLHNPTEVEAIQVQRPWVNVQKAVPFARPVKSGSGSVVYFIVSNPGDLVNARAYPTDWIIRYPTGCYTVQTDEQFQRYYGDSPDPS